MSIIFIDGFDFHASVSSTEIGVSRSWTLSSTTDSSLVAGRFGGQALRYTNPSATRSVLRTVSGSTHSGGFAFKRSELAVISIVRPESGANNSQFIIGLGASGEVRLNVASVDVATSATGVIAADTWCYIEFDSLIANSGGFVKVWVDGVLVIDFSGDTQGQAGATADRWVLLASADVVTTWDDLWIGSGDADGVPKRIIQKHPVSDSSVALSRSTGSNNHALVDEVTFGGTDYVFKAGAGSLDDLYGLSVLSYNPQIIYVVQGTFSCLSSTSAQLCTFNVLEKLGSTTRVGGDINSSSTTIFSVNNSSLRLVDPDDAPWDFISLAALEGGIRAAGTATAEARIHTLGFRVLVSISAADETAPISAGNQGPAAIIILSN